MLSYCYTRNKKAASKFAPNNPPFMLAATLYSTSALLSLKDSATKEEKRKKSYI